MLPILQSLVSPEETSAVCLQLNCRAPKCIYLYSQIWLLIRIISGLGHYLESCPPIFVLESICEGDHGWTCSVCLPVWIQASLGSRNFMLDQLDTTIPPERPSIHLSVRMIGPSGLSFRALLTQSSGTHTEETHWRDTHRTSTNQKINIEYMHQMHTVCPETNTGDTLQRWSALIFYMEALRELLTQLQKKQQSCSQSSKRNPHQSATSVTED